MPVLFVDVDVNNCVSSVINIVSSDIVFVESVLSKLLIGSILFLFIIGFFNNKV